MSGSTSPADGPLAGRRVVVTGASSGIGESTVRLCVAQGARVAAVARRGDRLRRLADELGVVPVVADLAAPGGPGTAVAAAAEGLDGIDVLVNNAGVYLLGGLSDGRPADWRRMFDLNVLSVLETSQAALPYLRESARGHVVNVSSVGGRRVARISTAVYSATKFALYAISEGMRQELHPAGVRVSVVSPGVVRTELGVGTADEELLAQVQAKQAAMGIGPDSVARAIAYVLAEPPEVAVFEMVVLPTAQPA
ncbi:SDR family oxidoreductase [Blastococcus sp. SYSU DS0616]